MIGYNCSVVTSCLVLLCAWLCSPILVSHDSGRLGGLALSLSQAPPVAAGAGVQVEVGLLLDLGTAGGKASRASIALALDDFYQSHPGAARISLHVADCKGDEITAASAAIDLLKNFKVQAIIGPKTSTQARFIAGLGNMTNVPILSFSATSPFLWSNPSQYFVRTALDDAFQAPAIAAVVQYFGWRQVVPIYEDSDFGRGVIPFLVDALQGVDARIPYRSLIPCAPTDDRIREEMYRLKTMQARVFVVHMPSDTAARLFAIAHEAEMLVDGYAWIVTDSVGITFGDLNQSTVSSMQGVLGLRPYVPPSEKLLHFPARFAAEYQRQNPGEPYPGNPNLFQLWAYDTAWAIATALQTTGPLTLGFQVPSQQSSNSSNDLSMLNVSRDGQKLIDAIRATRFQGISGDFALDNGQRQPSAFEIINVIGNSFQNAGFWTLNSGLNKTLTNSSGPSNNTGVLNTVIWPGGSAVPPKGWEWPLTGKKLQIVVPKKPFPNPFVNVDDKGQVTGYCIDIFEPYEFEHVDIDVSGSISVSYTDLCHQVYSKKYDAMVGDTTILVDRSSLVDFTMPYTESGVQMVVPMKEEWSKSFWIFMKPIENYLWAAILLVFLFTGFVVWLVEHKRNIHFGGNPAQQFFSISYFSFQAIITTPRDQKLKEWLAKFALINLLLLVWLLEKLYSASLTSMMTARQLQPTIVDLNQIKRNGDYVGYRGGSFVKDLLLTGLKIDEHKIRAYSSPDEYAEALKKGSGNGGVAAVFDEIPYLKLFMSKYCRNHAVVGRVYKTGGFGFVFPKGSPLVADLSRAILNVTEGDKMPAIEQRWFGDLGSCDSQTSAIGPAVITLSSLRGVFYITMGAWAVALIISSVIWFRQRGKVGDEIEGYDAMAEVSVENVEGVVWTKGRRRHLVFHLHGDPPPHRAADDDGAPQPELSRGAAADAAPDEPALPLRAEPDGGRESEAGKVEMAPRSTAHGGSGRAA